MQRVQGNPEQSEWNTPLITIITVVRNGEKTLEQTILSVLNQTYTKIEYIIIDGASTDGTLDIIKSYDLQIKNGEFLNTNFHWISESDEGVFDAMNKGIKLATGEWIGFLNSGDFYEIDAVEEIKKTILKNVDAGIIYGNTNLIISLLKREYYYPVQANPNIDRRIRIAPMFCHQSSFERRYLFESHGMFKNVKVAGEWLHFVVLFEQKIKFVYIDKVISNYLDGGISTTAKGFREAIYYKKRLGTFKYADYLRLALFLFKETFLYRRVVYPIRWMIKIFIIGNKNER